MSTTPLATSAEFCNSEISKMARSTQAEKRSHISPRDPYFFLPDAIHFFDTKSSKPLLNVLENSLTSNNHLESPAIPATFCENPDEKYSTEMQRTLAKINAEIIISQIFKMMQNDATFCNFSTWPGATICFFACVYLTDRGKCVDIFDCKNRLRYEREQAPINFLYG